MEFGLGLTAKYFNGIYVCEFLFMYAIFHLKKKASASEMLCMCGSLCKGNN
jgi:hypothetical protein